MTDKIVNNVVKAAVPDVLDGVAGIAKEFVAPVCQVVTAVGCKNQIVLAQAIAKIGPELVKYSGEIATKLVECAQVAIQSDCRESELIVKAVMDDSVATIQEKVQLVIAWKNAQTDGKVDLIHAATDTVKTVGKTLISLATIKALKEKGPDVAKAGMKAIVQMKKSGDQTRRSKERAKVLGKIAKSKKK
jgi:hypothetical protein